MRRALPALPHRRAEKPQFRPSRLARGPARCRVSTPTGRRSATWRRSWSGTVCLGSLKNWSSGKTQPTRRCWTGRGPRSGRAGGGLAPRTPIIRAPGRFSTATSCPRFHDPFAGGGSLPLEAQRLGLEAHASDLNPVAVLINKAMIEIPPKFAGKPPVNPEANKTEDLIAREWERGSRLGRRRALLRSVDARRGREADRTSVSQGRDHAGNGAGASRPEGVRGTQADRHRVAVGRAR